MVLTTPAAVIEQASTVQLLDGVIDESVRTRSARPIMMQFDPSRGWIWRRWKGTIFSETWLYCVRNMLYASMVLVLLRRYPGVKEHLNGFGVLWGQLLSVTTFTLTFFVNQSYALWRKCYELSRRMQGRLLDIGMNMATHATRTVPSNPDEPSTYTRESRQVLELMSRYVRLFNLITYSSFAKSHRPLLTPRGMRRLVERGLMTATEHKILVDAAIPATQRHNAILMWMVRLFVESRAAGHIQGEGGFEQQTMEKFHVLRMQYGSIGDELQGRMRLAYAHIVQILVDLILWMYPVMAVNVGMSPLVSILGTGLLTISYQGLFDLAKQFLDPYNNQNYGKGEDPIWVDTLIAETNAGSVRWMYGFDEMPFSSQHLQKGELSESLLPVQGYSVEELANMKEVQLRAEKEVEEERLIERQERLRQEAKANEEADATEKTSPYNTTQPEVEQGAAHVDSPTSKVVARTTKSTPSVELTSLNNETEGVHKVTMLADGTPISVNPPASSLEARKASNAPEMDGVGGEPTVVEGEVAFTIDENVTTEEGSGEHVQDKSEC